MRSADMTTGVIARLVWEPTSAGRLTSLLIKMLSIVNITAILWLEFSVFGDLAALTLGNFAGTIGAASFIVCLGTFIVVLIIVRYGLRGFVFADVLHSPFVMAGTLAVLVGLVMTILGKPDAHWSTAAQPLAPLDQVGLFVIHVFALNFFFVLVTEAHWLRLWIFSTRELTAQATGTIWTAAVWAVLALAGCLAVFVTKKTGIDGIVPLLGALDAINPALTFLFWFGASAALFSTTDAQVYGLLLVWNYKPHKGEMSPRVDRPSSPALLALLAAVLFGAAFALTRYLHVPFEKLVFALFPICLNTLPVFLAVATNRVITPWWTIIAVVLYTGTTIEGFVHSDQELVWTLAAALAPVTVSLAMLVGQRPSCAGRRDVQ